jgi:hypothetical protein
VSTHSIAASGEHASICEVVKLVDTELHDLLARREELTSRIQNLHQVIHGLREVVRLPGFVDPDLVTPESTHDCEKNARVDRGKSSEKRYVLGLHHLRLARACRIALMEVEGAASLEEIYSRIVRRDSFSLASFELAAPTLRRVLNAMTMTSDPDIRSVNDGLHQRWERVARVPAEETSGSL